MDVVGGEAMIMPITMKILDQVMTHFPISRYPIREETKRKLKKLEDGNEQIKQLLELIIQEGRGIEQESFIEVDLC